MINETAYYWVTHYGYLGIFALLLLGIIGLPVPDETLLTLAGYLVQREELKILPTIASAFSGSICGITISYLLGRTGGAFLIKRHGHIVHLTQSKIDQIHDWLARTGKWGLMFGYFLPGIRHLTALAAGASKLEYSVFALFAYAGGFIWSTAFIAVGYFFGREWAHTSERVHRIFLIGLGLVVLVLLLYYLKQRMKHKP